jgi:transcriptional regulator with XRE-family HTH domain
MPVGDRLKELRIREGQSLQDVADAIAGSKAHIWEIESNRSKNPSLDLLQKLASHFKVSVAYLIDEPEVEETEGHKFFRRNTDKFAKLDKSELKVIEDLLHLVSSNKKQ